MREATITIKGGIGTIIEILERLLDLNFEINLKIEEEKIPDCSSTTVTYPKDTPITFTADYSGTPCPYDDNHILLR